MNAPPAIEKPLVLVVDDVEETCILIRAILRHEFTVEVCNDGSEALEKLRSRRYAAILLDLKMPLLDGFEVLEQLSVSAPELLPRILIVTAALSRREIDRARGFGIHGIIAKPFDVEELLEAVKLCARQGGGEMRSTFDSGPALLIFLAELFRS